MTSVASAPAQDKAPGVMARLRTAPWAPWAFLLIAIAPMAVVCLVQTPVYPMSPDEQLQALFASGRYMGSGHNWLMPYSLAPLSVPLSALYRVLPAMPWYPLMLLGLIAASIAAALTVAARSRLSDPLFAAYAAVLLAFDAMSTMYLTFTIAAFLAVAAGLMLLLARAAFVRDARVHLSDVAGALLIVLGYSLRPESGMATFVLFAPYALWVLVRNRNAASIVRGAVAVGCVVLSVVAGQLAYKATPGWETYPDYLDAGRNTLDYPDLSVEEVRAIAPELSEADVEILYSWMFIDDGVFDTDFFTRLGDGMSHLNLENLTASLKAKMTYALLGLAALVAASAWLVTADIGRRDGVRVLALGVVLMLLASCALLIMRSRVRMHVVVPLAMCAVMAVMTCALAPAADEGRSHAKAPASPWAFERRRVAVPVVAAILSVVACAGFWFVAVRPVRAQAASPTVAAVSAYVEDHPDELIVFNRTHSLLYPSYDAFSFEGWEYPEHVLQIGGWSSHTEPWGDFLARHDLTLEHTLTDLVDRKDAVMVMVENKVELMETYLTEHVGAPVRAEVLEDLGTGVVDTVNHVVVCRFTTG